MNNEEKITELEAQIGALGAAIRAPTPGTWVNVGVLEVMKEKLEEELNELQVKTEPEPLPIFKYTITSKHTSIRLFLTQMCDYKFILTHKYLGIHNVWSDRIIKDATLFSRTFTPKELEDYIYEKFKAEVIVKELENEQ